MMENNTEKSRAEAIRQAKKPDEQSIEKPDTQDAQPEGEQGGFENRIEPTRYGDWEVDGRCSDF